MSEEPDLDDIERRMKGAYEKLRQEFAGLRTGRASTALLEPLTVDVYGTSMPINQIGTVTVPEPRLLSVQIWDKSNSAAVEKAIRESGLGLNPIIDGHTIRIPIPELNEERRAELAKVAGKYAEHARIAVRNVRRDGMEKLKRCEKDAHMSKDEHKIWTDEIQELTDRYIGEVDAAFHHKEHEITQV